MDSNHSMYQGPRDVCEDVPGDEQSLRFQHIFFYVIFFSIAEHGGLGEGPCHSMPKSKLNYSLTLNAAGS